MKDKSPGWVLSLCVLSLCFGCVGQATPLPEKVPVKGAPTSFQECVAAGGKILKSLPAQCIGEDGTRYIEDRPIRGAQKGRACEDRCGNGTCEEMVCMAVGCPCAESLLSCPQDCSPS